MFLVSSCSVATTSDGDIESELQRHEEQLLSINGVTGVGIQEIEQEEVIVVYRLNVIAVQEISDELEGFPVFVVKPSGEFEALPSPASTDFDDPDSNILDEDSISAPQNGDGENEHMSDIKSALQKHEERLLAIDGVTGIGIQDNEIGEEVIVVYLVDEAARSRIPTELDGFSVEGRISGEFDALVP